jgi:hypothetical protein
MKDKEIERERISTKKSKDNNYTKLLAEERKHANVMVLTEQQYGKAKSVNLKKHTLKTCTDTEKTNTALARAAQAAILHMQMLQNAGHFLNPRGGQPHQSFCKFMSFTCADVATNYFYILG